MEGRISAGPQYSASAWEGSTTGAAIQREAPTTPGKHDTPDALDAPGTLDRRAIPGPPSPPLVGWRGHLAHLLPDPVFGMLKLHRRYGDIIALGQASSAPVIVSAPEHNRLLLTNPSLFYNLDLNSEVSLLRMPQGTAASRLLSGVAGMNGEQHKFHRRMLMPAFHRSHVDTLRDSVVERVDAHIAGWSAGQKLDLSSEMIELSLAMAISGLLGLRPEDEGERIHGLLESWGRYALSPAVNLLPRDLPGLPFRRFLRLSEYLEDELKGVIQRKQAQMASSRPPAGSEDALSILLRTYDGQGHAHAHAATNHGGPSLTEAQLIGHLATLFSSGHETTASALVWTLFLLAQHPPVMSDLLDELDGNLHGEAPTLEQLERLPMLNNVISESLRLFPPGMWMLRTSTAQFEIGPYSLPARTHLVFSPAVTHHRPDLYSEPDRFLPGRWETIDPSPYEYLPFGAGPRRCLGATFAMLELHLAIAVIVQRFRFQVPDDTRVDRGGTALSFPRRGLPVFVYPQDRRFRAARLRGNIHSLLAH